MNKWIINALGLAAIACLGMAVWGAWGLNRHLVVAIDNLGGTSPAATIDKINRALDTVNHPCAPGPCGTLASVDKAVVKVGDILVTSQLQEKDVAKAAQSDMKAVDGLAVHIERTSDSLTLTSQSASKALDTASTTIAGLQPLETSLTATATASTDTINSLNARISDPRIDAIIGHVDSTSAHVDLTLGDLQKVADKTTGDILAPKPWWQKIGPYANDAVRAGCLLTGRCP